MRERTNERTNERNLYLTTVEVIGSDTISKLAVGYNYKLIHKITAIKYSNKKIVIKMKRAGNRHEATY